MSDDDIDAGECAYTSCIGDICENEEQCCENSACNAWFFTPESGYSENYCYPMCDLENPEALCKCDDICLDDGQLAVCLDTGYFYADELSFTMGADTDNRRYTVLGSNDYEVEHGTDHVTFDEVQASFFEADDGENLMTVRLVGAASVASYWLLYIEIYESTWSQGQGTFDMLDETGELNFFHELDFAYVDDEGYITEMWRETLPDIEYSRLTIHQICEPCAADAEPADCEECIFSFDLPWFAMRAKVEL